MKIKITLALNEFFFKASNNKIKIQYYNRKKKVLEGINEQKCLAPWF